MYSFNTKVQFIDRNNQLKYGTIVGRHKDGRSWVRVEENVMKPVWWENKLHKFDYYDALVEPEDIKLVLS